MKAERTSARHARALVELTEEPVRMRELSDELKAVARILAEEPGLVRVLSHPSVGHGQRAEVVGRLFSGAVSDLARRFLDYLARRGRLTHLGEILEVLEIKILEAEGIVRAEVVTAIKLDKKVTEKIQARLETLTRKKVEMTTRVSKRLIGGIRIRVGDQLIDGSIRHHLQTMRETLRNLRVG